MTSERECQGKAAGRKENPTPVGRAGAGERTTSYCVGAYFLATKSLLISSSLILSCPVLVSITSAVPLGATQTR